MAIKMKKAIFLDKDGTLIKDVPYNANPDLLEFYPDAFSTLRFLKEAGYTLIMITNQAGIAYGKFTHEEFKKYFERLHEKVKEETGIEIDALYYCPHHPKGNVTEFTSVCDCRKPQPGMIVKAAHEHNISLKDSWMIGDILNDIEAGNRAGCKTILIDRGNETVWIQNTHRTPHFTVRELCEITNIVN